ncbi:MAG: thioredoxin domain-containing protein, partial [Bauldia sp.]|nr:thioredoxin domain-containing protein [Bauldia sp.]
MNLLRDATSPYLLQHADNPVHWRPWGPEALAEATATGKPILLSVGYAACHWCHVMAHESFEDPATAEVMNNLFVNIKVDREERPDVDGIYMAALQALGEQGGWPLTMFLTPAGEPVWGGTYFPKEARYGRPAFRFVLEEVARIFREEQGKVDNNRNALLERLRATRSSEAVAIGPELLAQAGGRIVSLIDPARGGLDSAPKFPQFSLLQLLWRLGRPPADSRLREAVILTLRNICQGGIYDHLGGGMARYSVDANWLVPHFEKMLYDNAQFVERLTYGWLATGDPLFHTRIEETVGWMLRKLRLPEGAFASSLDADADGEEGLTYVWTEDELRKYLRPADADFFGRVYGVSPTGNWEGKSILHRLDQPGLLPEAEEARLAALRSRLLDIRSRHPQPARDDKILADWNGHAIAALALAGASLARPSWIDAARAAYRFTADSMMRDGRPSHAYRAGRLTFPGFASDHAGLIKAALMLHRVTRRGSYLEDAERYAADLEAHYRDPNGGYFLTADDADALVTRPKPLHDEALPSPNGQIALDLVDLWLLTGKTEYRDRADAVIAAMSSVVAENVLGGASVLSAVHQRLSATEVVILGSGQPGAAELLATADARRDDALFIALFPGDAPPLPEHHPAFGKTMQNGRATAYVCHGETCS